ncbi:MAG: ankyrin repeat domain-containing protein [Pseudomonadota bacterium]|nr:ankyrin repeat domain-containing protein [Pseudomonadota bacterium]
MAFCLKSIIFATSMAFGPQTARILPSEKAKDAVQDKAKQVANDKLVGLIKKGNSTQLIAALIRGANPNHTDANGVSLLQHARDLKDDKMAEALIRYGADKDALAMTSDSSTPTNADESSCELHQAVLSGQVGEVKKLLAAGVDINIPDSLGRTALHHAAITGNQEIIAALIANGADVNIKDNLGRTASDYADFAMDEQTAAALQPTQQSDEDYEDIIDQVLAVREQNKTCANFNNL